MKHIALGMALALLLGTPLSAKESQIIAGSGDATDVAELFFKEFSKLPEVKDYEFAVPPKSTKTQGGIDNSDRFLFGRVGRELTEAEKKSGKFGIALTKGRVTLATGSDVGVKELSLKDVEAIYTGAITNWKQVGGVDQPIELVGREETEAVFTALKAKYAFLKGVKFAKVFEKSDQVVNYLKTAVARYSLAFGMLSNLKENRVLESQVDLVITLGLVYDGKNAENPVVKKAQEYVASKDWKAVLVKNLFE